MQIEQDINKIETDLLSELVRDTRVIHTHISLLLITPSYTYKIKKAKDLGFLDFKLEKDRKHYCEEEIILNSLTAPDLYIKAVPLYIEKSKYTLTDNGTEAVDWAVKMNTFQQNKLVSNCLETISNKQWEKLSLDLVNFHFNKAKFSNDIKDFATLSRLKGIAYDNLKSIKYSVESTELKKKYKLLATLTEVNLNDEEIEFLYNKRRLSNKMRSCHGDLHLNNLCLINDRITPFDCIEFSKDFRYIDTLYDLSFLLMDLLFIGKEKAAYIILSSYIEKSNDYKDLKLLPIYLAMRSTIRAKVILIEIQDQSINEDQKAKAIKKAERYIDFAINQLKNKNHKVLIISGLSGSGKSYLSKTIQKKIPFIHLRSDVIRKLIYKGESDLYTQEKSLLTYKTLLEYLSILSIIGFNTIVDATFLNKRYVDIFKEYLIKNNVDYQWIYCSFDEKILKNRISKRKDEYSDADLIVLEKQIKVFDEKSFIQKVSPIVHNKDSSLADLLKQIG